MTAPDDSMLITEFPDPGASGITPMMAQYLEVKADHPDCLLFYRMGDFYEMFFGDAVAAAAALDITLTRRGSIGDSDIPMCGVPFHAAETYLSRLIRKGFRVAICEQAESPAEAKKRGNKGPLKRAVVRIVTPGTLVEDDFLPPRENNFLVALGIAGGAQALAWVDLSTGAFFSEQIAADRLEETLVRLGAAELIASDNPDAAHPFTTGDANGLVGSVALRPAADFDSNRGTRLLKELYQVSTLDGIARLDRAELAAAGALLTYLDQTQKGRDLRLRPIRQMTSAGIMEIDPASRRSLELNRTLAGESRGSLLSVIDKTVTAAGGRLMAARLAAPLTDVEAINARLDLATALCQDQSFQSALTTALKQMPDLERALSRLSLGHGGPRDLAAIADGLKAANDMAIAVETREAGLVAQDMLDAMASSLRGATALIATLDEALGESLPLLARDGGFIRAGADPALDELRALRDESRRLIAQLQARYAEISGVASLKIKHNNVLGYHIEVRSNYVDAMQAEEMFIHRQTTAQTVRFTTTELGELEREMGSAADRALALELDHFEKLVAAVSVSAAEIATTAEAAARLDVAHATVMLAETWRYCRPQIENNQCFSIRGGRHPVVEQMLARGGAEPFIANDCCLDESDRIWLLTGPNMAGKSTFLRQNALIAIMAQAGLYVPAEEAVIGVVDRLFCRVGAADDLATGRSTFMVEMVETAAILNRSGPGALVILDEIGRGTATYDGLSLAWAVVEYLHEVNTCRTLFATHYHELNALGRTLDRLSSHAMKVREWQEEIVFLHEVIEGAADRSYGIHVARLAGIPHDVLSRAEQVLASLVEENAPISASVVDDLPLFSVQNAPASSVSPDADSKLGEALDDILPDTMTPLEALEALYRLKALRDEK